MIAFHVVTEVFYEGQVVGLEVVDLCKGGQVEGLHEMRHETNSAI